MFESHKLIDDDRDDRPTSVRQAAEALFTHKTASPQAMTSEGQSIRKPRILPAALPKPIHREPVLETSSDQRPLVMSGSQVNRIKTWITYGMSMSQVAQIYGVTVGDIKRMLK